jgi:rubrerythrin
LESSQNADYVIDLMAKNEEAIGQLYRTYAARFPNTQDLWLGLAAEEGNHASWVRGLMEVTDQSLHIMPNRFRSAALLTFTTYVKRETVAATAASLQLISAISVALDIEQSLIERKYLEVVSADSPDLKQVLHDLETATRAHILRLQEALNKHRPPTIRPR